MKDVMRFIKWKQASNPGNILSSDLPLLNDGMSIEELFELSKKTCHYSKRLIDGFTEFIWQENLQHQLQLEGWPHIPKVSLAPLPLPHGTNQEMEVLVMSLFYINNLFNSFLFRFDRTRWESPLCLWGEEEQTALHLLTSCAFTEDDTRNEANHLLVWVMVFKVTNWIVLDW